MIVFVDTSAWLALTYSDDEYHEKATNKYKDILESDSLLITSDYIIDETVTRIRYDLNHVKAVNFIDEIYDAEEKNLVRIEKVKDSIIKKSIEIFKKYDDQYFSFADCTSFSICKNKNIDIIFAFDDDFYIMGFKLL